MRVAANATKIPWGLVLAVFAGVLGFDLALVAMAGTDIPFYDEWDVEGRLISQWVDGTLAPVDLFKSHNEHRLAWTKLLDLGIFWVNGQWDPLVELVAGGLLRALVAAGLAAWLGKGKRGGIAVAISIGVMISFVPLIAWHNALWGFQSQVLFCVGFSLAALALLGRTQPTNAQVAIGLAAGFAGLFAMATAFLVPVALLALVGIRWIETRRFAWREILPAIVLLAGAMTLRLTTPTPIHPTTRTDFILATGRALAWPHTNQPWSALILNLPLVVVIVARVLRRKGAVVDDAMVGIGIFAAAVGVAAAWARGGSAEWMNGVPSRYADFLVLLPLANAWCVLALAHEASASRRRMTRPLAVAWLVFLMIGWLGLSAEMVRNVILPRARDMNAPVRLTRAFQVSGDPAVFAGQPRLLVPHPDVELVRAVVNDSRLRGRLPPSLQPEQPMGSLSRGVRWLLRR